MSNEIEGQPVASCINEGSSYDIEARTLRAIGWHPPTDSRELTPSGRGADLLPLFGSETTAFGFPVWIWDSILGYLQDEPEALSTTEGVCRGWYPTSRRLRAYHNKHYLCSAAEVRLYARYINTNPKQRRSVDCVYIEGSTAEEDKDMGSLAHLSTFAAMFAGGRLPRLSYLWIVGGDLKTIPQSVFTYLSTFHSITSLTLWNITLPSIAVLLRLVCAFDSLECLDISDLQLLDRHVPPANRRWDPSPTFKKLTFQALSWPDKVCTFRPCGNLETSSGSATVLFLSNAVSCSNLRQLLYDAGRDLRELDLSPLDSLPSTVARGIHRVRVPNVDLSQNVGLRALNIRIHGYKTHPAFLNADIYGGIHRMISSVPVTVVETITINVEVYHLAVGPSIMSRVLLALRAAVCPPDNPLVSEQYTSLKMVELQFTHTDETSKRQMEADWVKLAPIWFPSLYFRGIIKLAVSSPLGLFESFSNYEDEVNVEAQIDGEEHTEVQVEGEEAEGVNEIDEIVEEGR